MLLSNASIWIIYKAFKQYVMQFVQQVQLKIVYFDPNMDIATSNLEGPA